jgi:type I restriction-modification system DNA methylase subunit
VFTSKEIHTSQLLGGRGRYSKRYLSKKERAQIYSSLLQSGFELENVALFNAVSSKKQVDWAFERLLNRFQQNMEADGGHFFICERHRPGTSLPRNL